MAAQLLLLEDVDSLGRKGDLVNVKPGFARNFLIPQGFAVTANKQTLRLKAKLEEERRLKAIEDKKESQGLAAKIEGITLVKVVKVDHEGHMYGSVSPHDVLQMIQDHARVELDRRSVGLKQPIKTTGVHTITLKLKEGVAASFNIKVLSEEEHAKASAATA